MNVAALFHTSVPVFRHYISRVRGMMTIAPPNALSVRLAPDTFEAGQHFHIAQNHVFRILWPMIGRQAPSLADEGNHKGALLRNFGIVLSEPAQVAPEDFNDAQGRVIGHKAGFAVLERPAFAFLTLYGLPNFFFHVANAYATLRQGGVKIGKGDFDGLHSYPADFSFETG